MSLSYHWLALSFGRSKPNPVAPCLENDLRLELNEEGDFLAPINGHFNAGCFLGNRTYLDQETIFVVPESQEKFSLTTGGKSNIFFDVMVDKSRDLKVEKNITTGP